MRAWLRNLWEWVRESNCPDCPTGSRHAHITLDGREQCKGPGVDVAIWSNLLSPR